MWELLSLEIDKLLQVLVLHIDWEVFLLTLNIIKLGKVIVLNELSKAVVERRLIKASTHHFVGRSGNFILIVLSNLLYFSQVSLFLQILLDEVLVLEGPMIKTLYEVLAVDVFKDLH